MGLRVTKRVADAKLLYCEQCDHWWTDHEPVPWGIRQTRAMHERGCPDHKLTMYRFETEGGI
jgi:hypothetical protein